MTAQADVILTAFDNKELTEFQFVMEEVIGAKAEIEFQFLCSISKYSFDSI